MSRFEEYDDYDGDDKYNGNGWAMWDKRAQLALAGKRGRKALADLREAILALPEKRLIGDALCTVNPAHRVAAAEQLPEILGVEPEDIEEVIEKQGEGVCAIGAFLWHQKVKAGMDPQAAFDELPTLADVEGGTGQATAKLGELAGLTFTLAWELAEQNDSEYGFGNLTPEQRYVAFLGWIDEELAKPPLRGPEPKVHRGRSRPVVVVPTDQIAMSL